MATNADLDAVERVRTQVFDNRFDTVLSARAALRAVAHLPEFHVDIVGNDKNPLRRYLVKTHDGTDAFTAEVHVGHRLHDQGFLRADTAFGQVSLMLGILEISRVQARCEIVREEKTDVVSGIRVLRSGISESNDEDHGRKMRICQKRIQESDSVKRSRMTRNETESRQEMVQNRTNRIQSSRLNDLFLRTFHAMETLNNSRTFLAMSIGAMLTFAISIGGITPTYAEDFFCGTSLTYDGDGNAYRTTRIGNQCWMRENLRR